MNELLETAGKLQAILLAQGAPIVSVGTNGASMSIFVYLSWSWPEMPKKIGPFKVYTALLG